MAICQMFQRVLHVQHRGLSRHPVVVCQWTLCFFFRIMNEGTHAPSPLIPSRHIAKASKPKGAVAGWLSTQGHRHSLNLVPLASWCSAVSFFYHGSAGGVEESIRVGGLAEIKTQRLKVSPSTPPPPHLPQTVNRFQLAFQTDFSNRPRFPLPSSILAQHAS